MADSVLVLPTEIPWANLKSRDLEETVYWLLDALGAKDLEWRRGGEGAGAADQGRDLEATFQAETPDGSFDAKRWWVEAKGRSRSVERRAVQNALNDAEVRSDVDVLVVVTNTTFTNPVRDFAKQWNEQRKRPMLKLWDRDNLEKLLSQHPSVVARLFAKALSPQGLLETVRERFWNRLEFASDGTLATLWGKRDELDFSYESLLAVIASEYANGDIGLRRWLTEAERADVIGVATLASLNMVYLMHRAVDAGASRPVLGALGHVVVASLQYAGVDLTLEMLQALWGQSGRPEWSQERQDVILDVITEEVISGHFLDACAADCGRVDLGDYGRKSATYWDRFRENRTIQLGERDDRRLVFERFKEPCKVGFPLDCERHCPLLNPPSDVLERLRVIEQVVRVRAAKPT